MQEIEVCSGSTAIRDVRVEVRFKNALLLRAMKEAGVGSAKELSRRSGVSYDTVCKLIGMRRSACRQSGEWHKAAFDIATALRKEPEEIFSWFQRRRSVDQSVFVLCDASSEAALVVDSADPERLLLRNELKDVVASMLGALGDRERQAVQMRFGFEPYCREHDYAEIGKALGGVTGSRAMMIVDRAVRRLSHPDRMKLLSQYRSELSV